MSDRKAECYKLLESAMLGHDRAAIARAGYACGIEAATRAMLKALDYCKAGSNEAKVISIMVKEMAEELDTACAAELAVLREQLGVRDGA